MTDHDHDHPDTDLTDPHGEAEALRKENERLRRWNKRLRAALAELRPAHRTYSGGSASVAVCPICDIAGCHHLRATNALAASRAPDPVANAGSCQPGDTLARIAAHPDAEKIAKEVAAILVNHIPAAPVAEAKPTIGGAELDELVRRLDSFDTRGQEVQQEHQRVKPGLYEVFWKSGGSSFAAFGCTSNGDNWFAPTNWLRPVMLRDIKQGEWGDIDRIAALTPPQDAELDALVARLQGPAASHIGLLREAAAAITALRAQPDWKAMAERLGDVLRKHREVTPKAMRVLMSQGRDGLFIADDLHKSDDAARAALSDLAKMKGE